MILKMQKKNRMFSIPYNGSNISNFLKKVNIYQNNINDIYLSLPGLHSHLSSMIISNHPDYDKQCSDFLYATKNMPFDRYVTLNSCYSQYPPDKLLILTDNICRLIEKYNIDGVICSNFSMAQYIRLRFPNIKISTSCNCFHRTTREMNIWNETIGVTLFNPPRNSARNINMLKTMHDAGFKLKVLINEICLIGCPEEITHFERLSNYDCTLHNCLRGNLSNIFKCSYVLPRWLKKLDNYVDVYKLSGRYLKNEHTEHIFKLLDIYLNGEECLLTDIYNNFDTNILKKAIHTSEIPDVLLSCQCNHCSTCKICDNLIKQYL